MRLKLLILLITSLYSILTIYICLSKWRWVIAKAIYLVLLNMISLECSIIGVHTLVYPSYRTITKIVWFIFIVFSIHFNNYIITPWWYHCWILSNLSTTFLILNFVLYVLILLIVIIVIIAMRSWIVYYTLVLSYLVWNWIVIYTFVNCI